MPLIGKVGRKTPRARLAMALLYTLLFLGAGTMVYPFLLMVSTAFKGPVDQNDNRLIPAFWVDEDALMRRHIDAKFAGDPAVAAFYAPGVLDPAAIAEASSGTPLSQRKKVEPLARPPINREVLRAYRSFLGSLPPELWHAGHRIPPNAVASRLSRPYAEWLKGRYGTIDRLNKAYLETSLDFAQVAAPSELYDRPNWKPPAGPKWKDWQEFRRTLEPEFRIPVLGRRLLAAWVDVKFSGRVAAAPRSLTGGAADSSLVQLPAPKDRQGPLWDEFMKEGVPEAVRRHGFVEDLWAARGLGPLPLLELEWDTVRSQKGAMLWTFNTVNFRYVIDLMAVNGRALWNTVIFCLLAIAVTLIVNPLAAYALSRYPTKATAGILLFLLATMAFPAEVAMIPSFLLIRDLGLLNTFWALVLPGAASGFSIFLLKGFFDSLPKELFESGQMDGASELTMMLRIALPLSRPVFGYMALLAFMGAYGAFMFAFLVAQDRSMWTLMVFIYQLQVYAPKPVMMAALTLAAVPTLVVFLFAQRTIMKGIVLPAER